SCENYHWIERGGRGHDGHRLNAGSLRAAQGDEHLIYIRNCTMRSSALQGTALAMLTSLALLYAPVGAGFWSGAGWAQDVPQAQRAVKPLGASQPTTPVPVATTLPVREPTAGMLGTEVAACDKDTQNPETLILPGAKGDFKLDRCYRGRDQFV